MNNDSTALTQLSDHPLIDEVARRAQAERATTAELIMALMEFDARKLYLGLGYSSMFVYCTTALHFSEHAYRRIEAARTARQFPVVLDRLIDGSLNLTTLGLVASLLTPDNYQEVLEAASRKSKRDCELLVATLRPHPAVPTVIRKLPEPSIALAAENAIPLAPTLTPLACETTAPTWTVGNPSKPAQVKPLSPEMFKVQFTISHPTQDKLRRAQDLLRHQIPNGDPAMVFDKALTVLLRQLERVKAAVTERSRTSRPRHTNSRRVPAHVRRVVWQRDQGRCAFVGSNGRCSETGWLEYHHLKPFAEGGAATVENISLRCRAHNGFEARLVFGRDFSGTRSGTSSPPTGRRGH